MGNKRFPKSETQDWFWCCLYPIPGEGTSPTLNQKAWPSKNALFWKEWNSCTKKHVLRQGKYALLMFFIFVNYWKYPLKSFYHRAACLLLCPHLKNSKKGWFFPNGKHFRCAPFLFGRQELDQKVRNWFPKWETRGLPNRKHKIDFNVVFTLFRGGGTSPTLNQQAWPSKDALFWKK